MATITLSRNLKLRISSDLTDDSRYNLEKLDTLGSLYQTDTNQIAKVRSQTDILIQTNDPDIGGSGSGGTVNFGSTDNAIDSINFFSSSINFSSGLGLFDTATSGTKNLNLKYKSDINGSVDTLLDRTLSIDVDGSDRELVLGGNLSILGANLSLSLSSSINWTLPPNNGSNGQVLTTDGTGTLSWESATSASLAGLTDTSISGPLLNQVLTYNGSEWVNQAPAGTNAIAVTWSSGDGNTKTVTHNFGTRNVAVQVIDDSDSYANMDLDRVTRPNINQVILESPVAPQTNWTIMIWEVC